MAKVVTFLMSTVFRRVGSSEIYDGAWQVGLILNNSLEIQFFTLKIILIIFPPLPFFLSHNCREKEEKN